MLALFDSLQREMTGDRNSIFPRQRFSHLVTALNNLSSGDLLMRSQENGWTGLLDYYNEGSVWGDEWGIQPNDYQEYNATLLLLTPTNRRLVIYEPCNTASNLAYYHLTVAISNYIPNWSLPARSVRALGESTAALTIGSSFYHASHTRLGSEADITNIRIMSYILHQAVISTLPPHLVTTPLLHLQSTPRQLTGVELSQVVRDMYLNQPVKEWLPTFQSLDVPTRRLSLAAFVCTLLTPILPPVLTDIVVENLMDRLSVEGETKRFIQETYLQQIRKAIGGLNLNLSVREKKDLLLNIFSAIKKVGVSFLFIERLEGLPDNPFQGESNTLGAIFTPSLNHVLDILSSYSTPNKPSLSDIEELYPGDNWCRDSQPHSLWHSQSAAGLLDLFLVADKVVKIFDK